MVEVKFSEFHKGWLAYKNGSRVQKRYSDGSLRHAVFATKEAAEKAAKKSTRGTTHRGVKYS